MLEDSFQRRHTKQKRENRLRRLPLKLGIQAKSDNPNQWVAPFGLRLKFQCCNGKLENLKARTDKHGGREGPGVFGSINLTNWEFVRDSDSSGYVKWIGWGRLTQRLSRVCSG